MPCNGFHISEVVVECVKQMEPVEESNLIAAVNDSLDPLFRMPPSMQKGRTRIGYIQFYIRHMSKRHIIEKHGTQYKSSKKPRFSRLNGLSGRIRMHVKDQGKCTLADIKNCLGQNAVPMVWQLTKNGHLVKTGDYYELTQAGLAFTVTHVDTSRRLCGFKPSLV